MYKLSIKNEVNNREYGSTWESLTEKNEYLDKQIAKQSWGKNERKINEDEISEELRSRIISTEVIEATEDQPEQIIHLVKADYVITEEDLSLDKEFRNKQKIEARKKEYRSIEEVIHIILDNGIMSEEFQALQDERNAIKAKYPKE